MMDKSRLIRIEGQPAEDFLWRALDAAVVDLSFACGAAIGQSGELEIRRRRDAAAMALDRYERARMKANEKAAR